MDTQQRNNLFAYTVTMLIAVVLLSALTYLGPPFGPTLQEFLSWLGLL